eukprot:6207083-Pleurochrysis_carterae.AAC.1
MQMAHTPNALTKNLCNNTDRLGHSGAKENYLLRYNLPVPRPTSVGRSFESSRISMDTDLIV